jgi:hypothetical protein
VKKPIIGAVIAALAIGGTAVAASGSSGGLLSGDPERDLAQDLAAELGGVSAGEVEQALENVAEDRRAEHRQQMAEAISANLDGVSAEAVADALAVADERMRTAFEEGEPPEPSLFAEVLAEELGVSEDEVESAMAAARDEAFAEMREAGEQRLDEAVESGDLSEEEAERMRDRLGEGPIVHEAIGPVGHDEAFGPIGPGGPPHVEFAIPVPER